MSNGGANDQGGARDDRLFQLQQALDDAVGRGETVDVAAMAERFGVDIVDVQACLRAAELLGGGAFAESDAPSRPPPLPEDFELRGELGRGGMGVVYRVHQRSLGRDVALKLVRADVGDDRMASRFKAEARSLARLRHPNIVAVHEVGTAGDGHLLYYTMDLVEGRDIGNVLRDEGPMQPARAIKIALQVARAVSHAHESGILHRDLKPANVLLDDADNAYVVDFGIARELVADRTRRTITGELLGTPAAMSPEQARGETDAVGERSDVYGLGVILYWMLAGRPPFEETSLADLLRAIAEREAPRVDRMRRSVPGNLATICAVALAKDPADRYQTAAAMAEDLERFAAGDPIAGRTRGPVGRVARAVWRRSGWIAGVVAAAAAVFAFVTLTVLPNARHADRLDLIGSLRDRGETAAALALAEELAGDEAGGHGDGAAVRALVRAQLDHAETLRREGKDPTPLLEHAGASIAQRHTVGGAYGGSAVGVVKRPRPTTGGALDTSWPLAERDGIDPWRVSLARHAALTGDPWKMRRAWTRWTFFASRADELCVWMAPARLRRDHPAHVSSIAALAGPSMSTDIEAIGPDDLAVDPWLELARVRDLLADGAATMVEDFVLDPDSVRRSEWAIGEVAADDLAELLRDPSASPARTRLAAALLQASSFGLPTAVPPLGEDGSFAPRYVERLLAAHASAADDRLRARIDLGLALWAEATTRPHRKAFAVWFEDATGAGASSLRDARTWWEQHRDQDPMGWLAPLVLPDSLDAAALTATGGDDVVLAALGGAVFDGVALRRAHDLAVLFASQPPMSLDDGEIPAWSAGGVDSAPGRDTDGRRRQVGAWLRALDRAEDTSYRLRLAAMTYEDGSPAPRIVARSQHTVALGASSSIDKSFPRVLPRALLTPRWSNMFEGLPRCDGGVRFALDATVEPGRGGAAVELEDRSRIHPVSGVTVWRDGTGWQLRADLGDVICLGSHHYDWPVEGWRFCEVVLFAALERSTDPDRPWSVEQWRARLETAIRDAVDAGAPLREEMVHAATYLAVPQARGALRADLARRAASDRRANGGRPYVPRIHACALLLAGDDDRAWIEDAQRPGQVRYRLSEWASDGMRCATVVTDAGIRDGILDEVAARIDVASNELGAGLADRARQVADRYGHDALAAVLETQPSKTVGGWIEAAALSYAVPFVLSIGWLVCVLAVFRRVRSNEAADAFAMRCQQVVFLGLLVHGMVSLSIDGRFVMFADWSVLLIAVTAIVLGSIGRGSQKRPWWILVVGSSLLCAAAAMTWALGIHEQAVPAITGTWILVAMLGLLGLDVRTRARVERRRRFIASRVAGRRGG